MVGSISVCVVVFILVFVLVSNGIGEISVLFSIKEKTCILKLELFPPVLTPSLSLAGFGWILSVWLGSYFCFHPWKQRLPYVEVIQP